MHILSFPPNCSHKLQPLDVSVYGPVKAHYRTQFSAWQKNNANTVLEVRHIAGLVCKTLDLALTPKTIKSGFAATGIAPFNPDVFSDADFVQAVEQNSIEVAADADLNEEEQRRIVMIDVTADIGCGQKVVISEPSTFDASTFRPSSSMSRATSSLSVLDEIGQAGISRKPSNRERRPMQSSELTSPDSITGLEDKKARAKPKKQQNQKQEKRRTQDKLNYYTCQNSKICKAFQTK